MKSVAEALYDTYTDTAVIHRQVIQKDEVTKQTVKKMILVTQDIKCRLSKNKANSINRTDNNNDVNNEYTLFMQCDVNIQAGDKVELCRESKEVYKLVCGKPFVYCGSHLEVAVSEEVRA